MAIGLKAPARRLLLVSDRVRVSDRVLPSHLARHVVGYCGTVVNVPVGLVSAVSGPVLYVKVDQPHPQLFFTHPGAVARNDPTDQPRYVAAYDRVLDLLDDADDNTAL